MSLNSSLKVLAVSTICFFLGLCTHTNRADAVTTDPALVIQYSNDRLETVHCTDVTLIPLVEDVFWSRPDVTYVGANHIFSMAAVPNDPMYSSQWYLPHVGLPTFWDSSAGSTDVTVAILDSGVDINHPDLSANIWTNAGEVAGNGIDDDHNGYIDDVNGWDFVSDTSDPRPKFDPGWSATGINHGTVVSGIAGAVGNNGVGVAGVNWHVKIMPLRVLNGVGIGDTQTIYRAIQYASANGADFINLSFVGDQNDPLLAQAITAAYNKGIITFAAAGNEGINLNTSPRYPACNQNVITVGGTNELDQRVIFYNGNGTVGGGSNYGSNCLSLVAPADNFTSTSVYDADHDLTNYYISSWYGTSFATPLVTGAAALLKSSNSSLTGAQIVALLEEHAVSIDSLNPSVAGQLGYGRVSMDTLVQSEMSLNTVIQKLASNIITGTITSGAPQVRVFMQDQSLVSQFFAYPSTDRFGVTSASGDVNNDGIEDVVSVEGAGGAPMVRIMTAAGIVQNQFFAYASSFRGGISVATGDVNGDGVDEIITGAGPGGGPHVRVFDSAGTVLTQFFAYATDFRKGITVGSLKSL
ncbi:MAG: S8 family serine peptidase [Patescibacteria group bacterium]